MSESLEIEHAGSNAGTCVSQPVSKRRLLRLWMVDDHAALRQDFAELLNVKSRLRVNEQFGSIQPMLEALKEQRPPDLILLDLHIGKENGLSAITPIKKLAPTARILMLTTFTNTDAEAEAFRLGANGFLLKIYEPDEIIHLIHQAFYEPNDHRLFPNLAKHSYVRTMKAKSPAVPEKAKQTGFLNALRQFIRGEREAAAE